MPGENCANCANLDCESSGAYIEEKKREKKLGEPLSVFGEIKIESHTVVLNVGGNQQMVKDTLASKK